MNVCQIWNFKIFRLARLRRIVVSVLKEGPNRWRARKKEVHDIGLGVGGQSVVVNFEMETRDELEKVAESGRQAERSC